MWQVRRLSENRMKIAFLPIGSKAEPNYILAVGRETRTDQSDSNSTSGEGVTVEDAPGYLKGFVGLFDVVRHESDRGAVLVFATMLDEQLKRAIDAFLVDHPAIMKLPEEFNAPISTFSTRTLLAFGRGLVFEREFNEIELIRKIRNEFAHSIDITFEHPGVSSRCKLLYWAINQYPSPRDQFIAAAASVVLNLLNRAHYVGQKRLSYQEWKV